MPHPHARWLQALATFWLHACAQAWHWPAAPPPVAWHRGVPATLQHSSSSAQPACPFGSQVSQRPVPAMHWLPLLALLAQSLSPAQPTQANAGLHTGVAELGWQPASVLGLQGRHCPSKQKAPAALPAHS